MDQLEPMPLALVIAFISTILIGGAVMGVSHSASQACESRAADIDLVGRFDIGKGCMIQLHSGKWVPQSFVKVNVNE